MNTQKQKQMTKKIKQAPSPEELKKGKTFLEFEEWEQERKMVDGKPGLVAKDKPNRIVMLLQEHADILNAQKENTLKEYVLVKESKPSKTE